MTSHASMKAEDKDPFRTEGYKYRTGQWLVSEVRPTRGTVIVKIPDAPQLDDQSELDAYAEWLTNIRIAKAAPELYRVLCEVLFNAHFGLDAGDLEDEALALIQEIRGR